MEKFMPCLRRQDNYLKFNEVVISDANIKFNKDTKILSFLLNCKNLKLIETNASMTNSHEAVGDIS